MPRKRKTKKCGSCDAQIRTWASYCSRRCFANSLFKSESSSNDPSTTRRFARTRCPKGPCVDCGDTDPRDVHHVDGNHRNNKPGNLVRICRSCHNKRHRTWTPCKTCGKKSDRNGYCPQHWYSWKTYGDPLQTERNGHKNFGGRKCSQKNNNGATFSVPSTNE